MTRTTKRPRVGVVRTEMVGAKLTPESRWLLETVSRIQQESNAAIIERLLNTLRTTPIEAGGCFQVGADGGAPGFDIAEATWAPEEWLRHLKMFSVMPGMLPPREREFWKSVEGDAECWCNSANTRIDFSSRYGDAVLRRGVPDDEFIEARWRNFLADDHRR